MYQFTALFSLSLIVIVHVVSVVQGSIVTVIEFVELVAVHSVHEIFVIVKSSVQHAHSDAHNNEITSFTVISQLVISFSYWYWLFAPYTTVGSISVIVHSIIHVFVLSNQSLV